jgi:hypothetical protein
MGNEEKCNQLEKKTMIEKRKRVRERESSSLRKENIIIASTAIRSRST